MPGYIYFIQDHASGLIKIGHTTSLVARFKALQNQSGNFLKLIFHMEGTRANEQELHEIFAEFRQQGEWFSPDERILNFIKLFRDQMDPKQIETLEVLKATHILQWQFEKGMTIPPGPHYAGASVEPI